MKTTRSNQTDDQKASSRQKDKAGHAKYRANQTEEQKTLCISVQ